MLSTSSTVLRTRSLADCWALAVAGCWALTGAVSCYAWSASEPRFLVMVTYTRDEAAKLISLLLSWWHVCFDVVLISRADSVLDLNDVTCISLHFDKT